MLYYEHTPNSGTFKEMIKSVHQEQTDLSDIYFSRENLELIQKELINTVRDEYKYTIDRQSEDDLLIIMRSYYTLYANPETCSVKQEIIKLNKLVIEKATKIVVTNIKMYKLYLNDASNLPVPLERSELFTSKDNDNIEFKGYF
jgi:hypothetical protein